jgi:hypothetical protein
MTKTIENLFILIATIVPILPIVLFFILLRKKQNEKIIHLLIIYCFIELVTNSIAYLATSFNLIKVTYSIFTVAEYLLFAAFFYVTLNSRKFKQLIFWVSIGFVVFAVAYSTFVKYKILDSIPIGVETLLILSYSFYYLYEEMDSPSQILIYNRFTFWIVAGILIYLAGSFFIYIFAAQVDKETRNQYWIFSNVFTTLKYILFSLSLYVKYKHSNQLNQKRVYPYLN